MTTKKGMALIIGDFWGKIIVAVMSSLIVGGIAFAFNTNADAKVMRTQITSLQGAKLPERMARIEQKVEDTGNTVDKMDKKLDKMLDLIYRTKIITN